MSTSSVYTVTDSAQLRKSGDALDGGADPQLANSFKERIGISGPVPKWIPITLLAFSSVAILGPVVLFRRYKANLGHSHGDAQILHSAPITSTAPPRRGSLRGSKRADIVRLGTPHSTAGSPMSTPLRTRGKEVRALASSSTLLLPSSRIESSFAGSETPVDEQDHFNAPLYTIKAFSIATAIVMSTAAATVAGVMSYLDVRDTAEFAAYMRTWVSNTMPVLSAKIYRRPTPRDTGSESSVALLPVPAMSQSDGSSASNIFDHDTSQQRLADAFDKGGFDAWAEVVERELEAEIEVERSRKKREFSETS